MFLFVHEPVEAHGNYSDREGLSMVAFGIVLFEVIFTNIHGIRISKQYHILTPLLIIKEIIYRYQTIELGEHLVAKLYY
jgi:hypothetical protein